MIGLAVAIAACGSSLRANFQPADGAPKLERAAALPSKTDHAPDHGQDLGLVEVSGDQKTSAYVCEQKMLEEAQNAGANVVYVRFSQAGSEERPASCHGEAYYVPTD